MTPGDTRRPGARRRGPTEAPARITRPKRARARPAAAAGDWIKLSKATLGELCRYVMARIADNTLDPALALGAYRAIAETINDRDALIESPPEPAAAETPLERRRAKRAARQLPTDEGMP